MPYSETSSEVFTYFEDWENEAIEAWLKERGYEWRQPTLCGSCCGFWNEEYYVGLSGSDVRAFNTFARERRIGATASRGGIVITEV